VRLHRITGADLPPDVFAIVMATGIIAVAADDHAYHRIGTTLGLLAGAIFVVLAVGLVVRIVARPRSAVGEITDPDVALRLFTSVAACGVLGVRFVSDSWALWVLAITSLLAWLFLAPLAIRDIMSRPRADLRDHAHGAWLLPCVATAGLATSAADLATSTRSRALLVVGALALLLALFIYCAVAWLIGYRAAAEPFVPESVTPDSWILMGAISTLAGDHLLASAGGLGMGSGFTAWVRPLTLAIFVVASVLIPLLLYASLWRIDQRSGSLHYTGVWWSAVFPIGMFSAATAATARQFQLPALVTVSLVFFWVALTVWLLIAVGLIHLSVATWRRRHKAINTS
jgi:tellurite resistance protein TehA-like permease